MGTDKSSEECYSPWKLDPDEAQAQIRHFLTVAVSHLVHLGFEKERLSTLGNAQDTYIRWVAIDDVPVYRAIVMPDVDADGEEVMAAYGVWLDAAEGFFNSVRGAGPDAAADPEAGEVKADDEVTDPGLNPADITVN